MQAVTIQSQQTTTGKPHKLKGGACINLGTTRPAGGLENSLKHHFTLGANFQVMRGGWMLSGNFRGGDVRLLQPIAVKHTVWPAGMRPTTAGVQVLAGRLLQNQRSRLMILPQIGLGHAWISPGDSNV